MKSLDLIVSEPQDFFCSILVKFPLLKSQFAYISNKTLPGDAIICKIVIKFSNS